jgi:hypothetical protein
MSPRSYQARVDVCRLWDLMLLGRSQAKIARIMGKDAAWVSRAVKKLQTDTSLAFHRPKETETTNEHLGRLESLYFKALAMVEISEGKAQVTAIRTAATLLREKAQFLQFIGLMQKDQESALSKKMKEAFPLFG